MSITDELRAWAKEHLSRSSILAIADRIDAEHKCAVMSAMNDALYHANDENMAELGWVRLPKDADGVPIRVGDVMEFSAFEIEKPVTRMVDGIGQGVFFAWCGERGYQQHEAKRYRHHHEPTVEDVLREMAAAYMDTPLDDSNDGEFFAKYAAKLRLAGDGE